MLLKYISLHTHSVTELHMQNAYSEIQILIITSLHDGSYCDNFNYKF